MQTITVSIGERSYKIYIGNTVLTEDKEVAALFNSYPHVVLVADDMVWQLYSSLLRGISEHYILVPQGEASKSQEMLFHLYNKFIEKKVRRDSLIVSIGGGVIGDLSGYAAATFMRGVPYVQLPTTLLAQVDSSIGGKTAINLPDGKNLVGVFYQPEAVIIDTRFLATLPHREWLCGMAEIIKYALIRSPKLFDTLRTVPNTTGMDSIIFECCKIKAEIIARDVRDTAERMLLNFGHTFGHAIESASCYKAYTHGEAIALGMVIANRIGEQLGITQKDCSRKTADLLARYHYPIVVDYSFQELYDSIMLDKKCTSAGLKMVFLKSIGDAVIQTVDIAAYRDSLMIESFWRDD